MTQKGLTLADVTSTAPEYVENLYALGYNLYTSSNHKDAEVVFQALCLYNHKDMRFWMGLAGCRQANGNLKGAIDAYSMAGTVALMKDPQPFLYAARCYIQLGDKENAIGALKGLVEIGDVELAAVRRPGGGVDRVRPRERERVRRERGRLQPGELGSGHGVRHGADRDAGRIHAPGRRQLHQVQ